MEHFPKKKGKKKKRRIVSQGAREAKYWVVVLGVGGDSRSEAERRNRHNGITPRGK